MLPKVWFMKVNYLSVATINCQEHFMECYREALQREKQLQNAPQEEMDQLLKELRAFTLASHFFWGLWSVCSASISTIPFDYWVSNSVTF
jgi:choline/ethanolamine kinase